MILVLKGNKSNYVFTFIPVTSKCISLVFKYVIMWNEKKCRIGPKKERMQRRGRCNRRRGSKREAPGWPDKSETNMERSNFSCLKLVCQHNMRGGGCAWPEIQNTVTAGSNLSAAYRPLPPPSPRRMLSLTRLVLLLTSHFLSRPRLSRFHHTLCPVLRKTHRILRVGEINDPGKGSWGEWSHVRDLTTSTT